MGLLSKFFSRPSEGPLPGLEPLFQERGVPLDLPGLEPFLAGFEHMGAHERVRWADAVAGLHRAGRALPPEWTDAQYELRPELVPTWKAEREGLYYRPAIDGLSERVRIQGSAIPSEWIALWDVAEAEVLERALDLLREDSKGHTFERLPSGIYRATFRDGNCMARLLLPELWKGLFPGQNLFLAVPRADALLVAPQVLLPKLVEAIQQALAVPGGDRGLAVIYTYVDGKLLPANLQDPHPIAQPQRELRQMDLMEAYRVQDGDLDADLGAPCPLTLLRTNQGRTVTMALWAEGRPALLPDCDTVGFVAKDGRPLGVYFRQTLPRIPELHGSPVDLWGPRRVRYEGFPTAAQLDRLEVFASPEAMAQIFKAPAAPPRPKPTVAAPPPVSSTASPVPAHLRGQTLGVQAED